MIPDSVKHPAKMSWNLLERIFKHLESLDMLTHESIVIDFMAGTGKTGTMAALRRYRTISVELEPHFIEMIAGYDCDGKSISDFKIEPCVCKSDTLREPPSDKSDGFSRPPEGLVSQHIPEQERMDIVGSALCEPSFRGQPVNSKYVSQVYISNPHNNNEMEKGGTIHPPDKSGGILYPSTPRYKGIMVSLDSSSFHNWFLLILRISIICLLIFCYNLNSISNLIRQFIEFLRAQCQWSF
ncbi:site-specific DNA-methyltransferase [Patescibacteria group bacterium]|nr:site-specific DNA-methyltransferase [Patescibacteria group bacterium]